METILDKVSNIEQEVKNTQDFHRLDELLVDLENKLKETPAQEIQTFGSQLQEKSLIIHANVILTLNAFSVGWEARKTGYEDKQLEDGEKLAENLLKVLSRYGSKSFPADVYGDDYVSKSKTSLNTLKGQIEEEKQRRENPGGDDSLDKQIEKLKNQIKGLEQKLRDTPDSDASLKNSYREKIRSLKNSLAEKEREKNQSEKGGFPTEIVVGIGVGAVVALLVVFIFMQFNKRRDY